MRASTSVPRKDEPGTLSAWLVAIRPKTLPAAISPVVVGTAVAHRARSLELLTIFACLIGSVLLQIASNLANDVFDHEQGKDTAARLGPTRAVQAGLLTPRQARMGLAITLVGCVVVGSFLVAKAGWPLLAVGVASMLAAVAYTAGPFPLGYHGLGELFVFLFFGPIAVLGTEFALTESISAEGLWASVPLGALITNILVVNNLRDRDEDGRTGKRTLAVRFGERFCLALAAALLTATYLAPLYYFLSSKALWPWLFPMATLPASFAWLKQLRVIRGRAMNPLLGRAAQLALGFSLLFGLGLWVSP